MESVVGAENSAADQSDQSEQSEQSKDQFRRLGIFGHVASLVGGFKHVLFPIGSMVLVYIC
jgi:hypothetical protein